MSDNRHPDCTEAGHARRIKKYGFCGVCGPRGSTSSGRLTRLFRTFFGRNSSLWRIGRDYNSHIGFLGKTFIRDRGEDRYVLAQRGGLYDWTLHQWKAGDRGYQEQRGLVVDQLARILERRLGSLDQSDEAVGIHYAGDPRGESEERIMKQFREKLNQCDGCLRRLPVRDGIHYEDEKPWIYCTAARYKVDLLAVLEEESWGLLPVDVPTGGDDSDVRWVVIEYHMADPQEREIGHGRTPTEAIESALASQKEEIAKNDTECWYPLCQLRGNCDEQQACAPGARKESVDLLHTLYKNHHEHREDKDG